MVSVLLVCFCSVPSFQSTSPDHSRRTIHRPGMKSHPAALVDPPSSTWIALSSFVQSCALWFEKDNLPPLVQEETQLISLAHLNFWNVQNHTNNSCMVTNHFHAQLAGARVQKRCQTKALPTCNHLTFPRTMVLFTPKCSSLCQAGPLCKLPFHTKFSMDQRVLIITGVFWNLK